jgi:hypothetical protein
MARLNQALSPSSPSPRAWGGAALRRTARAALVLAAAAALLCGCAGPPVAGAIQGEPVCPDFVTGAARTPMEGGLRLPVRLRILDGKTVMTKLVLHGKRSVEATSARTLVADDNAEYTVEWAQCVNECAPVSVADARARSRAQRPESEPGSAYECGEAEGYKTDKLVTKKGDAASHALTFAAPPKAECWQSDVPPPPPSAPSVGAGEAAGQPALPTSAAGSAAPGMSAAPAASGANAPKSAKDSVPPK